MNHCMSCKFWRCEYGWLEVKELAQTIGQCHRRAPVHDKGGGHSFPRISSDNGCGEWKSNPAWVVERAKYLKRQGREDEALCS